MSPHEEVLRVDAARRAAMIAADVDALDRLLADDLSWTHSSGTTEDKAEFIAAIAEGSVVYAALEIEQDQLRGTDDLVVHNGLLIGRASRSGQEKALCAKFLAVWQRHKQDWQLVAWQSTNCDG